MDAVNAEKKQIIWNKYFIGIFIYALLMQFTMTVTNYALPLYVVNGLGGAVSVSGVLSSVFAAGSMLCRFTTGNFVDKYGRRTILIIGALVITVSMFALGLTKTLFVIIVFKFIQGVGHSLNSTASNAAAADVVPKDRYSEGIGMYTLHSTIVGAIGATIIIWLMTLGVPEGESNYTLPLFVAAGCGAVGLLIAFVMNYEKKMSIPRRESVKKKFDINDYIERRALLPALLVMFQSMGTGAGMFLLLYATDLGLGQAMGMYFILQTVVTVIARFTLGKVVGRIKPMYVILLGIVLQIAAYVYIAVRPGLFALYFSAVMGGIFGALLQPTLNALSLKSAPVTRSGAASATYWLGFDIGMAITPIIFGVVIDVAGYATSFLISAAYMAVFAVCAVFVLRKTPPVDLIEQPAE